MAEKNLSKDEIKEMLNLRRQGWTMHDLGIKYGVTYQRVQQLTSGVIPQGECKYCGAKTQKYQTICVSCYAKLKLVRELKQIGELIKSKTKRQDKQTPMNVIVDGAYFCPRCNTIINFGEHSPHYCSECGQHLLWR